MNRQQAQPQGYEPAISRQTMAKNVALSMPGAVTEQAAGAAQRRLLNARVHWCQENRAQTGPRDEKEGWLAEEEGLHDAMLGRERVELIRLCYPLQVERYRLGFHDGQALLCIPLIDMQRRNFSGVAGPNRPQSTVQCERRIDTGSSSSQKEETR